MIKIRYKSYEGHPLATFVSKLINILSYFLILFSFCFFIVSLDSHPIDIPGAIICALVFISTILVLFNHDKIIAFLFFRSKHPIRSNTKKQKKQFFKRYDTYIVCPHCGSLVSKGTKICDCGEKLQHFTFSSSPKSSSTPSAIPQDDYEEKKRYAQMRVDAFYTEIFAGQTNPFTGLPVKSEKDYLEYLRSKKKAEVSANGESANSQSSMGRSFSELVRDEKLEQAKINAMTKEAYAQYRVDKVCAELFKGQINPYTQKPITCEADFREYQRQHNS